MPFRFEEIFNYYSDEEMGADYELLPRAAGRIHRRQPGHHRLHSRTVRTRRHGGREGTPERPHLAGRLLRRPGVGADPPRRPPQFGTLPLIIGTLLVSLVAILIALPLGLGVAIYLSELAGDRMRGILKPAIELLAGIPSVVYGFFGLVVLVPLIQKVFQLPVGETAFAGSLVLAHHGAADHHHRSRGRHAQHAPCHA